MENNNTFKKEKTMSKESKQIRFVSKLQEFHFCVNTGDTHTDSNGNNKLPTINTYAFTKVLGKDPITGKVSGKHAYCYFIADPEEHGAQYDKIVKLLNDMLKNPDNKLYTAEGYEQVRNPEAAAQKEELKKVKSEFENKLSEKDSKIAELEKKLGLSNRR
jgi:hypothetical protein